MSEKTAVSIHYGHNATVGFSRNGRIECLISEERISRMKNATGFPYQALKFVVDHYLDGNANSVDAVVINDELLFGLEYLRQQGFQPHKYLDYYCYSRKSDIDKLLKSTVKSKLFPFSRRSKERLQRPSHTRIAAAQQRIGKESGIDARKVHFLNHHKSHALTPFYFLDESSPRLVMTIDGEGDGLCATVSLWNGSSLETLDTTPRDLSLGYLYSEVTAYMGMKSNEHEFKVMGMAPYAHHEQVERLFEILKTLLWFENGRFISAADVSMRKLRDALLRNLVYERFDNICGGIQLLTERILTAWVQHWIRQSGVTDVAVSGGVMMNVKAVKCINELPEVNSLFVVPSAGDESLVIGGLYHANRCLLETPVEKMTDLYLGRGFSDEDSEAFFSSDKTEERYSITRLLPDEMAETAAEHLANNHVVACCSGREEWGARALGNRSIMCNAHSVRNIDLINQQIKKRDFWMPFTPSIIGEDIDLYIDWTNEMFAPYMAITFDSTPKAREEIPAALHPQDRTVRPQQVLESWNPEYYDILQRFKQKTGVSGILNTSFNLHGEPNVGGPADAIHTLDNSGLNYLILGSYWIEKKQRK